MTFQSRSTWTTEPNRAPAIKQRQRHLTWHYPGFGNTSIRTAGWSHDRCLRQIKAWDRMHRARGSKAIEYNYFACPHGHVIEGRGNRQNAANGTGSANRAGQSCQVLVGDTEPLSAGHLRAMTDCAKRVEDLHPGITSVQYGHRHWVSTSCPGSAVMSAIPIRPGRAVATAPTAKADPERPWLSSPRVKGMTAEQVRAIQAAVGVKVDGKYGDATGGAVKQLQDALDLTADGVWGPTTERTVVALTDDIKALSSKIDQLPRRVLDEPVALEGKWKGKRGTLRGLRAWYAEDLRQIKEGIATSRAAILEAVQETGREQGLTDAQVQKIVTAAAEAAARVGAEDVAEQLTVTVKGE